MFHSRHSVPFFVLHLCVCEHVAVICQKVPVFCQKIILPEALWIINMQILVLLLMICFQQWCPPRASSIKPTLAQWGMDRPDTDALWPWSLPGCQWSLWGFPPFNWRLPTMLSISLNCCCSPTVGLLCYTLLVNNFCLFQRSKCSLLILMYWIQPWQLKKMVSNVFTFYSCISSTYGNISPLFIMKQ